MSLEVAFRRAARSEFDEATARYEAQRVGLGVEFTAEIDRCVALAAEHPQLYASMQWFDKTYDGSQPIASPSASTSFRNRGGSLSFPSFTVAETPPSGRHGSNFSCTGRAEARR
jgi:hypothetical protein